METITNLAQKVIPTQSLKPASQQTILVTGASGFVAAHVIDAFLKKGYKVRGTVRNDASGEGVKKTHAKYASQLEYVIVKDIAAPGAFDNVVQGVDGVIHTASPFQLSVEDNERDLLLPAINGTTSVLEAVSKHAPEVKRIVITASFASILDLSKGKRPGYTYTEDDWNPTTYEEAKTGNGAVAYCASKAFAERAAYDFVKEKKPNFDIATINPPMIYGPPIHNVTDLSKLNTSSADIYRFVAGNETEIGDTAFPFFADVRDVAEAHLRAYEVPAASNKRFIITSGGYLYQDVCEELRTQFPELKSKVPDPSKATDRPETAVLSNQRAKDVLGLTFRSLKETIFDTATSLVALEKQK